MAKRLSKDKQKTWDRLTYVHPLNTPTWTYGLRKPAVPTPGAIYFDHRLHCIMIYDGAAWKQAW